MPQLTGVVETCLYVSDVARSRAFYQKLFGLKLAMDAVDDRFCPFAVAPGHVLILFRRGGTTKPIPVGGGFIPTHDGEGPQHVAFGIETGDYETWRDRLESEGIAIESEVEWPAGGRSMYIRDPDGLLVELVTRGLWRNY